ncbi:MAG: PAS domain-containing protein [Anaerolineae bacterium]
MDLFARRKDASVFPAEIQLSSVQTFDSFLMMSFVLDVTERKRMIAALERQRVFLREVIDASPSMIFVKDIEGRFIFANPAMAIMFNTTVDELMAKFDHDLSIREHEIAGFHEIDRRVITRGETVSVEESVTLSTGDVRWIQTTKVPLFSEDGLSIHALGISTDITERKKAEIALQQALAKEKELGDLKTRYLFPGFQKSICG